MATAIIRYDTITFSDKGITFNFNRKVKKLHSSKREIGASFYEYSKDLKEKLIKLDIELPFLIWLKLLKY